MSGVKRRIVRQPVGPYESCLAAKRSCTKRIRDGRLGDDALPVGEDLSAGADLDKDGRTDHGTIVRPSVA